MLFDPVQLDVLLILITPKFSTPPRHHVQHICRNQSCSKVQETPRAVKPPDPAFVLGTLSLDSRDPGPRLPGA